MRKVSRCQYEDEMKRNVDGENDPRSCRACRGHQCPHRPPSCLKQLISNGEVMAVMEKEEGMKERIKGSIFKLHLEGLDVSTPSQHRLIL